MNPVALLRAAYGATLLTAPSSVLKAYGGPADDDVARAVARVLGARHVLQAIVTRRGGLRRVGAVVDSLHAASMFALAAVSRTLRRPAVIDGSVATTFAAWGALRNEPREA